MKDHHSGGHSYGAIPNDCDSSDDDEALLIAESAATARHNETPAWRAHENTAAELPPLLWLIGGYPNNNADSKSTYLEAWFRIRWQLRYPLQYRLVASITVGEVVILMPLLAFFVGVAIATRTDVSGSGMPPELLLALTLSTATHNSIWTFLLGLPFERAMRYHQLFGALTVIMGGYHGYVAYYTRRGANHHGRGDDEDEDGGDACPDFPEPPCMHFVGSGHYLSGFVFEAAMLAMVLSSIRPIRRRLFNFFWSLHLAGVGTAIVAGIVHGGLAGIGVVLWIIDLVIRYAVMSLGTRPSPAKIRLLKGGIVCLEMDKPPRFHFKGGQYVFLCVPGISLFEWHPFSISSAPNDEKLLLHVRPLGNWTAHLHDIAIKNDGGLLSVLLEGPYGTPTIDIEGTRYNHFVLISGGIGITPLMSTANELIHQRSRGRKVDRLHFVWSVRDPDMIEAMSNAPGNETPGAIFAKWATVNQETGSESRLDVFQPQLVTPCAEDSILTDFYLTCGISSPLTAAQHSSRSKLLHFGRPNLDEIVSQACECAANNDDADESSRVAVLFCGPSSMGTALQGICRKYGADFHKESFEL